MYRMVFACVMLLVWSFSPTAMADVQVKKLMKQKWIGVESERFSVMSNASPKKAGEMLDELENFNYFMTDVLGFKQNNLEKKIPVILAKNKSSFVAMGIAKEYAGVFSKRSDGDVIFARADKFRAATKGSNWGRSIVLHELVHLLISGSIFELSTPPWFNEGVAEYFSTYKQTKDSVVLGDMSILGNRFYGLIEGNGRRYESVDTASLFKVRQADLKVGAGNSRKHNDFLDKFYARSVAVVHYLNADVDRRKQMYLYLHLRDKEHAYDAAFEYAFKMTYAEFDALVDEYIRGKYMLGRTFPVGPGAVEFPIVEKTPVDITLDEAMETLFLRISGFSDRFLGEGVRYKMNSDFEKLIPGFFE
ncbi:hypothetical protein [Teredinibacter purpureus]|uniref:hypothetical protein n=1 Tax=Teredinibacter purpureus TaxID=2731756 RepID=UPI0013C3F36D|nr:hypothetical protein [Teredinibacter purpureus]